jgi:hypothetical protein
LDSELAYFCENQASGKPGGLPGEVIFQTGSPVMSGAFERIWADTPCRRPIQTIAFLSFRIVHHRRNLNPLFDATAAIRRSLIGIRRESDRRSRSKTQLVIV